MATDLKTQLQIGADVSGAVAGIQTTKKSLKDLGQAAITAGKEAATGLAPIGDAAAPAAGKVDAATRNMIGSIQRQIAVMEAGSRSGADYFRVLAGQRGIDTTALKPYLDQLDAIAAKQKGAQAALQQTTPLIEKVGVSSAQTAQAMRQLPAQFSDIVVSLQGGQAPLTVLLQQGSQIKDSFGGMGAAAQALGGYISALISPLTVGAAVLAAFGLAAYQGSQESQAYTKALILTGNAAGRTAGDLQLLAATISRTTGTQGQAAEALAASIDSGKIAAAALESVSTAAVSMSRVLGTSIDDAVKSFEKLSEEPTKASAKLNEQFHYLNLATYERIRVLEEQGRKEEAAALAQTSYANSTSQRLKQVEAQAGLLSRAWRALGDDARKAWDLMQGIGRPTTLQEQIGAAQAELANRMQRGALNPTTGAAFEKGNAALRERIAAMQESEQLERRAATSTGEQARAEAEKIAAAQRLAEQKKATRSKAALRKDEIEQLDRDAKLLGIVGKEYDDRVAAINEKYKDPKGPAAKPFQDDASTKMLATLRQQEAAMREQLTSAGKLTDAEREQAKFAQLIADIKDKGQLTADQKSLLAAKDKIKAQLEINVLVEREIGFQKILADDAKRRKDAEKATANAAEGNRVRIADALQQQREQYDEKLGVIGLGSEAAEQLRARQQIEREYSRMQTGFTKTAAENATLETDAYKKGVRDIAEARAQALQINSDYFDQLKAKQGDWSLGASQALANYADESANVFKQTENLVTKAFSGMEDALVSFVMTGKADFKSLANSIIADFIRIQVRSALTTATSGAGGWSKLLGGLVGGFSGNTAAGIANVAGGSDSLGTMIGLMGLAGARADGGPVDAGKTYLVGERGQELFVPKVPGNIVPNHQISMGTGGLTIHNNAPMQITRAHMEQTPQGPQLTIDEIAAQFDDPNSKIGKAYRRNYRSERALP
ncbi:phage tail tape measure protein [Variovorax boronicumulans]|uniref:phage tail tape measure protein n=1 Tax=Variovorax boronicumulans TaxID=436515 RepID=UPI001C56935B